MKNLILFIWLGIFFCACTKQEDVSGSDNASQIQKEYLLRVKHALSDSLSTADFNSIDFDKTYKSNDTKSGSIFLRLGFKEKAIADEFILLKTDSAGNISKAKIVHVDYNETEHKAADIAVETSALKMKKFVLLKRHNNQNNDINNGNVSALMEEESPAGEQTLADVVVTGYIYDEPVPYYWYLYDAMLGDGYASDTYIYFPADPQGGGGGGSAMEIDFENPEDADPIDIEKYIKCFGTTQESSAIYTITIATDIPVDGDPSQFFNWTNASPGHTYIELYKNSSAGLIEQNIGFYPSSSWKTAAGSPTSSKMVDNAGHEYNARYTISVTNTQFQAALTAIQTYSSYKYDIANFNCTDFALGVFNAAGGNLSIPKYSIPGFPNALGGSNTPQGLYNELDKMDAAGYQGIEKPGIKGYGDASHGACD